MDNVLTESTVASADDKVLSGHVVAQTSVHGGDSGPIQPVNEITGKQCLEKCSGIFHICNSST